jgi:L-cysteine S-thiosulfotransferase
MRYTSAIVLLALLSPQASAEQKSPIDPARVDAVVKSAFSGAPDDWQSRLAPDETMRQCTEHRNSPPAAIAEAISKREQPTIVYPADGKLLGDWKKGEALAQSGYGLRFTDYPARNPNGGNCYGCHQLTKGELSYGTLGPSLLGYGKLRNHGEAESKAAYEKIFNSQAALPCSNMPRFGANKILTVDQIADLVALLMSRASPVNE